jgi:hypothetical protein
MSFNLPGTYGTSTFGLPSQVVIVTDGPHRLVSTTPVPVTPSVVVSPATENSGQAKESPLDLLEPERQADLDALVVRYLR